ncbi:hypothetical protein [Butyrivibrio sp. LC3010]|uniref:hypothetical protein n=1 Tax=Butyrivibrio sp. LC3010 TaxID=1280680 RepID=UPI0012DEE7BA|nr:hypothetical protein [Butyrivibrio sp. LC3010]
MKKKRLFQRQLICMILSLILVMFTACGSDSGADDPNLGLYEATTANMSGFELGVKDVFEDGFSIELKKNGKAHLQSGDEGGDFKWTLEGETFHGEGGGATFDGTLKNGVMVLENVEGSGVTLTLECSDIIASLKGKEKAVSSEESDNQTAEVPETIEEEMTATTDSVEDNGLNISLDSKSSVSGYYDAIAASVNDGDEVYIEPGEYLNVYDDGSLSMYVAEQNLEFATTIEDNKFYLNGDTKVGEIAEDGSITLNLSDDVKYVFAKEGSEKWNEWQASLEENTEYEENEGYAVAEYDFNEAVKLVGDYEGFMLYRNDAYFNGKSFENIGTNAFARIVIDPMGKPQVYIRTIMNDASNVKNLDAEFRGDGWLTVTGTTGTDNGDKEWTAIISPAVGNAPLNIDATLTSDYETVFFTLFLKPINSDWDYSYLDDDITEDVFNNFVYNLQIAEGDQIEDKLQFYQNYWDKKHKEGETFTMITDQMPDPSLLNLYK